MVVEKFSKFNKHLNKNGFEFVKSLLVKLGKKGYKYSFAASSIYAFTKDDSSIIFIYENEYLKHQELLKDKHIKHIGGYNVYEVDEKLNNPFFKSNRKLESLFYFEGDDDSRVFKKIRYFMNKVMATAEELGHYPIMNYDSKNTVQIICYTHDTGDVTDKDLMLADKITKIWNVVKK